MTTSCAACGARVETDGAYCPACGAALGIVAPWPAPSPDLPFVAQFLGEVLTVTEAKLSSGWYAIRLRWWRFLWQLSLRRHF
jgi:hypothetical protein